MLGQKLIETCIKAEGFDLISLRIRTWFVYLRNTAGSEIRSNNEAEFIAEDVLMTSGRKTNTNVLFPR